MRLVRVTQRIAAWDCMATCRTMAGTGATGAGCGVMGEGRGARARGRRGLRRCLEPGRWREGELTAVTGMV